MRAHTASLINAISLIGLGTWGCINTTSVTAYIPIFVGVVLLILNNGLKKEDKVISHIVVLVTFLFFISLIMPLKGAIGKENYTAVFRVAIMMLTSLLAIVAFIKSFRDARKRK